MLVSLPNGVLEFFRRLSQPEGSSSSKSRSRIPKQNSFVSAGRKFGKSGWKAEPWHSCDSRPVSSVRFG